MPLYDGPPPVYGTEDAHIWRWIPGKSGPRFIQDLSTHIIGSDKIYRFPDSLTEAPFDGDKHSWILDLGHEEEFGDRKVLRACCERTRMHIELSIEYGQEEKARLSSHCLAKDKLHHFQLNSEQTVSMQGRYDSFVWSCSRCSTTLSANLRGPEVPDVQLQALYKIRPQSSFSRPSSKQDQNKASRFSTLQGLEYLLRNTANFNLDELPGLEPREIPYMPGSMFEMRVGHEREVIDMMKALMFVFCPADHANGEYIDEEMATDEMEIDGVEWVFRPTNPAQAGVRAKYNRLRLEMQILATKAHEDLGDIHRNRPWKISHIRAEKYMRRLLDSEDRLFTNTSFPISFDDSTAEEACYHKLGVTSEFLDSTLLDFYELQVKHDNAGASYYLSALEAIGKRRNSLLLLTKLSTEQSLGRYTRGDVKNAYIDVLFGQDNPIDLDAETVNTNEDDETLINLAASMMMDDTSRTQKLRRALEIIAQERDSREIRQYLNDADEEPEFHDYNRALTFLGAEIGTDDDFLITLYDIKQEENTAMARAALSCIANKRESVRLKYFLDTGKRDAIPSIKFAAPEKSDIDVLDPDLAYSRLGVDDRNIEDEMLITLYEIRALDDPDEASDLKKALELLGDVRNSTSIKSFIATGSKETVMYTPPEASSERPVGLENIGNTCYLNSLLQYYFTIQPLRQAILIPKDLLEEDITAETLSRKKVGGRSVSREEIERAQRFLTELRKLFRSLIDCRAASLKPSRAVCFLALVSQKDEKTSAIEDSSTLLTATPARLVKGTSIDVDPNEHNQLITFSPSGMQDKAETTNAERVTDDDESQQPENILKRESSITWATSQGRLGHELGPSPDLMDVDEPPPAIAAPIAPLQQAESHSEQQILDNQLGQMTDGQDNVQKKAKLDIDRAGIDSDELYGPLATEANLVDVPAVPFRRRQSSLLWSETNDWGRQQDVAECIDNVLFQIEAGMKPSRHDPDGEQVDLIKDLFYGRTKQILEMENSEPKFERFSNTIVILEKDEQDIYQALDGVFGTREVELGGKQVSLNLNIANAPPVLQIQIQRVGFDLKTMSAVKSNLYLALDQSIYLDRYMDNDDSDMLEKRESYWRWKKELANGIERRNELENLLAATEVAGPIHNDHIWSATANEVDSSEDDDNSSSSTLHQHLEFVGADTADVRDLRRGSVHEIILEDGTTSTAPSTPKLSRTEIELELRVLAAKERDLSHSLDHLFDNHKALEYRLHAVFIHRGEASHGHYWVYLYDFRLDKWRKYNDEEVTDVPRSEIFKDRKGSPENPYMLTYIKSDRLHYIDALERDLEAVWEDDSLL